MCLVLRKGSCFIDLQIHLRFNKYLSLGVCLLTPIERTVSWQTSESFSTSFKGYCELHTRKKQLKIHLSGRLLKTNSQEISFIYEAIKSVFPLLWIWQSFLLGLDSTGAPFFFFPWIIEVTWSISALFIYCYSFSSHSYTKV